MKKIIIGYWINKLPGLKYNHLQEINYSLKNRNKIINEVLNLGYYIMLKKHNDNLIVWIDNKKFTQR